MRVRFGLGVRSLRSLKMPCSFFSLSSLDPSRTAEYNNLAPVSLTSTSYLMYDFTHSILIHVRLYISRVTPSLSDCYISHISFPQNCA